MRMRHQDRPIVNEISEYIKKIQKSTGEEKKSLILKAKKKFQIEKNEKWVITKLRLLLVGYEAEISFFGINPPESRIEKDSKQSMVSQCFVSSKRKMKCLKKEKHISKSVQGQKVKPRLTLTEKQLYKLRNATFKESEKGKIEISKLEYMKFIGLHAEVICLS